MKIIEATIETLEGGAVIEAGNHALQQAFEDLVDPNKVAKAERKITITIALKPKKEDDRMRPSVAVAVKFTGAPYRGILGDVYLEQTHDGLQATQIDPEQMALDMSARGPAEVKGFPQTNSVKGE